MDESRVGSGGWGCALLTGFYCVKNLRRQALSSENSCELQRIGNQTYSEDVYSSSSNTETGLLTAAGKQQEKNNNNINH